MAASASTKSVMRVSLFILFLIGSGPAFGLVGGRKAAPDQFPSILLLEDCTATKIGDVHFLLAAHCVVDAAGGGDEAYQNQIQPKFSEGAEIHLDRKVTHEKGSWTHTLHVVRTFVHPAYRYTSVVHPWMKPQTISDIAVVVVDKKTPEIPVMDVASEPVAPGSTVVKLGYGCPEVLSEKIQSWVVAGGRELHFATAKTVAGTDALESYFRTARKSARDLEFYSTDKQRKFLTGSFNVTKGQYHAAPPKRESEKGDSSESSLGFSDSGGPLLVEKRGKYSVVGVNAKSLLWPKEEHKTKLEPVAVDLHTRVDTKSFTGTSEWLQGVLAVTSKNAKDKSFLDGQIAVAIDPEALPKAKDSFDTRKYLRAEERSLILV